MGGISAILGFLALVGFLAFLGGVGSVVLAASQGRPVRGGVLLAVVGLAAGLIFSVISQGIVIVQPQEVGVVFNTLSGNLGEPRRAGTHVVVPVVQQYTLYNIAQQEYTMSGTPAEGAVSGNDAVRGRSQDGQEVLLDITIIYSVDPAQANRVHTRWQNRYEANFVRPTARGQAREIIAGYSAAEIYGEQRGSMEDEMQDSLTERFDQEGLILNDLLIRDITFSEEFSNSIEQARIAEQRAERARLEVAQREQEAEQARAAARGERDAQILRAEGEAQSRILRAQAEAEALRLVSEQIAANPSLIQYEYINQLSDNVSLALVPSNSPFLFDFNSLSEAIPDFRAPEVPESELDITTEEGEEVVPESAVEEPSN